ncbi:MAG: translocation/assembly module TamB domain-containing protein [Burkholderiaceae bacterium]
MSDAPVAQPAQARRRQRPVWWLLLWLPTALLALFTSALVAAWLWSASPSSLGLALRWTQAYLERQPDGTGPLTVVDAEGSLRRGGRIGQLRWEQEGLTVVAHGIRLGWPDDLLWSLLSGRRLDFEPWHIDTLEANDHRAPAEPSPPPTRIELPVALHLPWSIDTLILPQSADEAQGKRLQLDKLRGTYSFDVTPAGLDGQPTHRLALDNVTWADGDYSGELRLGSMAPLPLQMHIDGRLRATVPDGLEQDLTARLEASGQLAGTDSAIDLTVRLDPASAPEGQPPTIDARGRIRPWSATQPLESVDARIHRLDLAMLWPTAPHSTLSGTLQASPKPQGWQASVAIDNATHAPLDQQGLPLDRLQLVLSQVGDQWEIKHFELHAGDGRIQGEARFAGAGAFWNAPWSGRLEARHIDPSRFWKSLAAGRIGGTLEAQASQDTTGRFTTGFKGHLSNDLRPSARSGTQALFLDELDLRGRWQGRLDQPEHGQLELDHLLLQGLGARVDGSLRIDVARRQAEGQMQARAPGWSMQWKGTAAPNSGQGELKLDLADAGHALDWARSLTAWPWLGPDVAQALSGLDAQVLEGRASATLGWQGGLAALGFPVAASAATPTSTPPSIELDLNAPSIRVRRGADAPAWEAQDTRLRLAGPLTALDVDLQGQLKGDPGQLTLEARGRLGHRWPGTPATGHGGPRSGHWATEQLRVQLKAAAPASGTWRIESVLPTRFDWTYRDDGIRVTSDALQLRVSPPLGRGAGAGEESAAVVHGDGLTWDRGALSTRGRFEGLPLAWADLITTAPGGEPGGILTQAGIRSDLLLRGQWHVQLPASANELPSVQLHLERQQGDLSIRTEGMSASVAGLPGTIEAGVKTARLDVLAEGREVQGRLRWSTERLGDIDADLRTGLSAPTTEVGAWHWAEQAPLAGHLRARLPKIGVWAALAPPGWRVQGALEAEADISGSRAQPLWRGELRADRLAVRSVVEGIAFTEGQLRATLQGDRIQVQKLSLQGPGGADEGGSFEASGTAEWRSVQRDGITQREPLIDLKATARQLRVSNRPDRRLTLSGAMTATLEGRRLDIGGRLAADSALFLLPDELTPALGKDVVLRGHGTPLEASSPSQVQTHVNVDIDLGPRFEVRGQGLSTRLAGQITVRSTPAQSGLRVVGDVRTQSGSYRAYGQQLRIESGLLRFSGPYDDPALDIVAIRPNLRDQRVGVQIGGTAQRPKVSLFSDPDMPESDKLAWLVLGRAASGSGAEAAVLQQAALALLAGDGEGVGSRLAGFLGLDQLDVVNRGADGDAVSLGKRFSDRLYLNYERGLLSTLGTVSVFYELSRWLTLRARAGEENAIDVIFLREYD